PQLQRIYGTAFKTKKELDDYFAMLEEAKKRDHRKLGKELEIYIIDEDVGPGLPLWLPRGAAIIEELEKLAKETEFAAGYQRVRTVNIAREQLYKKSGHLPYYAESMFPPMTLYEVKNPEAMERSLRLLEGHTDVIYDALKSSIPPIDEMELPDAVAKLIETIPPGFQKEFSDQAAQRLLIELWRKRWSSDRYYLKAMNCPHHH